MKTQYIKKTEEGTFYYKDPEMKILHRLDGPAREWANGNKDWWSDDRRHRLDGPAVEWTCGHKEWFIHGLAFTEWEFDKRMKSYSEWEYPKRINPTEC